MAPPRVNSARLAAVKYRCTGYDVSMPVPPCTWTAVCATRWPASAAQNLAVATAAATSASSGWPVASSQAACHIVSQTASTSM